MIDTTLTWRRIGSGYGPGGSDFVEYACDQEPAVTMLVQHRTGDGPAITTFHVEGVAKHYRTAEAALEVVRAL